MRYPTKDALGNITGSEGSVSERWPGIGIEQWACSPEQPPDRLQFRIVKLREVMIQLAGLGEIVLRDQCQQVIGPLLGSRWPVKINTAAHEAAGQLNRCRCVTSHQTVKNGGYISLAVVSFVHDIKCSSGPCCIFLTGTLRAITCPSPRAAVWLAQEVSIPKVQR